MADYDFYTLFDSLEFQDFARDMVQIREGITFESFARGTDLGIDGRYVLKDGSVMIFRPKALEIRVGRFLILQKRRGKSLISFLEWGLEFSVIFWCFQMLSE